MAKRKVGRPKNRVPTCRITIQLPKPDYERLVKVAEKARLTPNVWIAQAVIRALEALDEQRAA